MVTTFGHLVTAVYSIRLNTAETKGALCYNLAFMIVSLKVKIIFTLRKKNNMYKKIVASLVLSAAALSGCSTDADIASHNLSKAADNFEVNRRIVFYNGINGEYMLSIEGLCSLGNDSTSDKVSITCKVAGGNYKKHFLGLSDNVTYFIEQLEPIPVGTSHYVVIFKPSAILPDVQMK